MSRVLHTPSSRIDAVVCGYRYQPLVRVSIGVLPNPTVGRDLICYSGLPHSPSAGSTQPRHCISTGVSIANLVARGRGLSVIFVHYFHGRSDVLAAFPHRIPRPCTKIEHQCSATLLCATPTWSSHRLSHASVLGHGCIHVRPAPHGQGVTATKTSHSRSILPTRRSPLVHTTLPLDS